VVLGGGTAPRLPDRVDTSPRQHQAARSCPPPNQLMPHGGTNREAPRSPLLVSLSMPGEALHQQGADGANRAKLWLESTTRADARWVNPHPVALRRLTFDWCDGSSYSFDLGGILRGDEVDGQEFLAEVKAYKDASDQGTLYEEYLAKCFRALHLRPERCDNFLWITWAPFKASTWSTVSSAESVRRAVAKHCAKALGEQEVAWEDVPEETAEDVSQRLWIIVLSERQERVLRLTPEHMSVVEAHIVRQRAEGQ
jgi:hypothetical protein